MNHTVRVCIVHQMDPLGRKIGGIETFIRGFVKHAPEDFEIEWLGVTSDRERFPVGLWHDIAVGQKPIRFFPLVYLENENVRTRIPLSLKFTLSLFRHRNELTSGGRVVDLHRIEPSSALGTVPGRKILFVHGNMLDLHNPHAEVRWRTFPWLYFAMEKRLIGHIDHVYVVRQDGVQFYQDRYPFMAARFAFMPTWVDEDTFYPYPDEDRARRKREYLQKRGFQSDSTLVLFVGRLEGQKDPLLLVDTFNHINRQVRGTKLLIAGTGALRGKMDERIKKYGLEENVAFLGAVPQSQVADLLRISDVFLLTSAFEGMPMSVLEALASGLPVVSTDVGEVRRVVRDGFSGTVCDRRDAAQLGEAVVGVLKRKGTFSVENCLSSIGEYTARRVLQKIYECHYLLGAKR